jgi:hypothetical protein
MNEIIALQQKCLNILLAPNRMDKRTVNLLIANRAIHELVCVLDGGNCFDGYGLARTLRKATEQAEAALGRVRVARAFTCHQMVALLSKQSNAPHPIFILELLATFCDENIPDEERLRLLESCIAEIERLASQAMVLVTLSRTKADPKHLARLQQAASKRFEFEEPQETSPPRLF